MEILSGVALACELARLRNKWAIFYNIEDALSDGAFNHEQALQSAPLFNFYQTDTEKLSQDKVQATADGTGVLLFDTEAEMLAAYLTFVGDDGPTLYNPYKGKYRSYALTISSTGQALSENT